MKRAALITNAGLSNRFSESLGRQVLKCIYYEKNVRDSILGKQLNILDNNGIEEIYIVGGHKFDELKQYIESNFSQYNIHLIYNPKYDKGTCYSFYCGIREIQQTCTVDELLFLEGDIFAKQKDFQNIIQSKNNVLTYNDNLIDAEKSVIFYQSMNGSIKYLFDTSHSELFIPEPFKLLGNSGQIWKFDSFNGLCSIFQELNEEEMYGTNLIPIEKYFINHKNIDTIKLSPWINCNTIDDYKLILEMENGNN